MIPGARVFVGLGSNLGDSVTHLLGAIDSLASLAEPRSMQVSRFYRSRPWGDADQPDFVNAVVGFNTRRSARDLLTQLLDIEALHGRNRSLARRNGPRTLDLDLLLYGELQIDEDGLQVPHPRMADRAFVIMPLMDLAPNLDVPGVGVIRSLMQTDFASLCWPLDSTHS